MAPHPPSMLKIFRAINIVMCKDIRCRVTLASPRSVLPAHMPAVLSLARPTVNVDVRVRYNCGGLSGPSVFEMKLGYEWLVDVARIHI